MSRTARPDLVVLHREGVLVDTAPVPTCVASSGTHERIRLTLGPTGLLDRLDGRIYSVTDVTRGKPEEGCRPGGLRSRRGQRARRPRQGGGRHDGLRVRRRADRPRRARRGGAVLVWRMTELADVLVGTG